MPFLGGNTAQNVSEQPPRSAVRAAWAHIATASHVLIALWDGAASEAAGGTVQIVRFRAFGVPREYLSEYSELDAPDTGIIYHVYAPRRGEVGARQPGELQRLRAGMPTPETLGRSSRSTRTNLIH